MREALVAALGAGVLVACTRDATVTNPDPSARPDEPTADEALLDAAALAEEQVVAAYRAQLAATPDLFPLLAPLLEHHEQHLAVLAGARGRVAPSASASPLTTSSSTASPAASAAASASAAPASPGAGVRALLAVERTSLQRGRTAALQATDGGVALRLAEVAASDAQHVVVLDTALRTGLPRGLPPVATATPAATTSATAPSSPASGAVAATATATRPPTDPRSATPTASATP